MGVLEGMVNSDNYVWPLSARKITVWVEAFRASWYLVKNSDEQNPLVSHLLIFICIFSNTIPNPNQHPNTPTPLTTQPKYNYVG